MAALRTALGFGAGAGAALTATQNEFTKPLLSMASAWLASLKGADASAAQPAVDAQIAALTATVTALSGVVETTLRAQSAGGSSSAGTLLLVGAPLAGVAYYFRGLIGRAWPVEKGS